MTRPGRSGPKGQGGPDLSDALQCVNHGWRIFPVAAGGKSPAIAGGHGLLDAATDPDQIRRWWTPGCNYNIGCRPPDDVLVLDVDPRNGGDQTLRHLIDEHGGEWWPTLTSLTGGGGYHLFFHHPGGDVRQLPGIDLKDRNGYVVFPPSIHPSGRRYRWRTPLRPIGPMVPWLIGVLRPLDPPAPPPRVARPAPMWSSSGLSPADWFVSAHRWADVLVGWTLRAGDGEHDGSRWRHPTATSPWSATVKHGLLFVYSPNAGLPVTETGHPHGLTRFAAWAHLVHGGDLSAAALVAREMRRQRRAA